MNTLNSVFLQLKRVAFSAVAASVTCCAMTSCALANGGAGATPFNPDKLDPARITEVSDICQTVMGLSPSEPLSGGYWLGKTERLDYYSSYYRGCVTSLSDSLQHLADTQAARRAGAACREKGLPPGTSELALCVLQTANEPEPPAAQASAAAAMPVSDNLPHAAGSFFYARAHDANRREQTACAALGFEPPDEAFKGCVKDLKDTFYALDTPIT